MSTEFLRQIKKTKTEVLNGETKVYPQETPEYNNKLN